ncbi:DUF5316 domain-containing protein [Brevibacillus sp. SAFN-007a]|uniref:DUF5316 domain-containing protein n=1 Tax=Brevibacillus sp. SAFN-007a TaxID=3436862 RepID=UPI003F7E9DED
MKRSLRIGFSILVMSLFLSLVTNDFGWTVKLSGSAGVLCILLSAIFTGSFVSGDRMRANHAIETREDRQIRVKWARNMALIGLPNLLAAIVIVFFLFQERS